jgi:hypothetical protein
MVDLGLSLGQLLPLLGRPWLLCCDIDLPCGVIGETRAPCNKIHPSPEFSRPLQVMMDPLSISASIIAVLQATNSVVSLCYDFRAALKNAPWSLTRIIEEVKDLRRILETLDRLAEPLDDPASADAKRRPVFQLLCDPENGPLAACLRELSYLEEKITSASWVAQTGSRRRAFIQAVGWQLKDRDATLCLERIERCKSSLNLAITADEA